jgi:very-long-chain ceramide synthase
VLNGLLDENKISAVWDVWPRRDVNTFGRRYYLLQASFRLSQIIAINFERRRKDFQLMIAHHVITLVLVTTSYTYHFIPVGTLILCIMDVADMLLPVSARLKAIAYY